MSNGLLWGIGTALDKGLDAYSGEKNRQQKAEEMALQRKHQEFLDRIALEDLAIKKKDSARKDLKEETTAEKEANKKAGILSAEWGAGGGSVAAARSLFDLGEAQRELEDTVDPQTGKVIPAKVKTGSDAPWYKQIALHAPKTLGVRDAAIGLLAPEIKGNKNKALNAITGSIKQMFPGALSDKDIQIAFEQVYDETLPNSENVRRIKEKAAELASVKAIKDRTVREIERTGNINNLDSMSYTKDLVASQPAISTPQGGLLGKTANASEAPPRKFYSAKTNRTKLVYSDGREEIVDGKR